MQFEPARSGSRAAQAAGAAAGAGRAVGPPRSANRSSQVGGLRRVQRHHELRRAGRRVEGEEPGTRLVMRAVALPELPNPTWAVVLDLPLSSVVEERIMDETSIRMGDISDELFETRVTSRCRPADRAAELRSTGRWPEHSFTRQSWVVFLDTRLASGDVSVATVAIRINIWDIYNRISVVSQTGLGNRNFSQLLLVVLAVVGTLFLIIQFVAIVIGFVLAKQITGAVHDLFTEPSICAPASLAPDSGARPRSVRRACRIVQRDDRRGDDAARRDGGQGPARAGDVRRARDSAEAAAAAPFRFRGLTVTAFCEPAREVAGDYFDFMPITDDMTRDADRRRRGQGPGGRLYMAQLKVIVQSLGRLHHDPASS